jgi:hypothetical protein
VYNTSGQQRSSSGLDPSAITPETSSAAAVGGDHAVDQVWSKAMSRYQRARVRPGMLVAMDTVAARSKKNSTVMSSSEDGSPVDQPLHEDSSRVTSASSSSSSSSTTKGVAPKRRVVKSKPVTDDLFVMDGDADDDKMDGEDADDDKIDGEDNGSVLDDIM